MKTLRIRILKSKNRNSWTKGFEGKAVFAKESIDGYIVNFEINSHLTVNKGWISGFIPSNEAALTTLNPS